MIHRVFKLNNKRIIEKELERKLKNICLQVNIMLQDWEFDVRLFNALKDSPDLDKTKSGCLEYDAMIEVAQLLNIKLQPKYYWFYKLNN